MSDKLKFNNNVENGKFYVAEDSVEGDIGMIEILAGPYARTADAIDDFIASDNWREVTGYYVIRVTKEFHVECTTKNKVIND